MGGSRDDFSPDAVDVYARFESFGGPRSLEHIRGMDASSLRNLRDPERLAAFHDDTFKGSTLNMVVASVAEARERTIDSRDERTLAKMVRRADRVHLDCGFNLREGIASSFRVSKVEELLTEQFSDYYSTDSDRMTQHDGGDK